MASKIPPADLPNYLRGTWGGLRRRPPVGPADLQADLDAARPGEIVVAKDGTYRGHYIVRQRPGTSAAAPVVLLAESPSGAELTGELDLLCTWSAADGLRLRTAQAWLRLQAAHCRATRIEVIGVSLLSMQRPRGVINVDAPWCHVDRCELRGLKDSMGIRHDGQLRNGRSWIERNLIRDSRLVRLRNAAEPIQVGRTSGDHGETYACVVENNLLLDCHQGDAETISTKSSDNIIYMNTLRNARRAQNRGGVRNRWIANWLEGGGLESGLSFCSLDNQGIGNRVVGTRKGILVQGGSYDLRQTGVPVMGLARADGTRLVCNVADLGVIGDDSFRGSRLDAIATVVRGHRDEAGNPVMALGPKLAAGRLLTPVRGDPSFDSADCGRQDAAVELGTGDVGRAYPDP